MIQVESVDVRKFGEFNSPAFCVHCGRRRPTADQLLGRRAQGAQDGVAARGGGAGIRGNFYVVNAFACDYFYFYLEGFIWVL